MKKTLFLTTLAAGIILAGCNRSTRESTAATDTTYPAPVTTDTRTTDDTFARADSATRDAANDVSRGVDRAGDAMRSAGRDAAAAMSNVADNVSAKLTEWRLSAQDIEADIRADRPIVRTKDAAGAPTGTMDKSTLKNAVEGRIKADPQVGNLKLDVNAKSESEIELEGKAQSAEQIGRAIALALDTEGVNKVTSKIDIDDNAVRNR
jgi:hypothetical protein